MPAQWYYETRIVSTDEQWTGGILSVPRAFPPSFRLAQLPSATERLTEVADALGFDVLARELRPSQVVLGLQGPDQLEPSPARDDVINDLLFAPLVIVEESPPVGRALLTLGSWGGAIGLLSAGASPVILVVYGTAWVVGWVAGPVVRGVRAGVEEGVRDAVRDVVRERADDWLRNRAFGHRWFQADEGDDA